MANATLLLLAHGMQELWGFPIWGKGVKDHYHPPAPLLVGPSKKA